MEPSLTWLDLTAADQKRMRRVLDLFHEPQEPIAEWATREGSDEPAGVAVGGAVETGTAHRSLPPPPREKCVDALEPDVVIVDEFQRFRSLL